MRHDFMRHALLLLPMTVAGLVVVGATGAPEIETAPAVTEGMQAQYQACRDLQASAPVALAHPDTGPRTQRPAWLLLREAAFTRCLQSGLPGQRHLAAR